MNFLAHIFLSGEEKVEILIGNFIADFVKGKEKEKYSAGVRAGIEFHYQIDYFTDQHACFRRSVERLKPSQGKYAPVLIDLFYDHFLAVHWDKFHKTDLITFNKEVSQRFSKYEGLLPEKVRLIIPRMVSENWLPNYGTRFGIEKSLENLNRRAKFSDQITTAIEALQTDYKDYEQDFVLFFPEIMAFCEEKRP